MPSDTRARNGVIAMLMTCAIWGLSPIYYKFLTHIPAGDVLAHRTFWSLIFFGGILAVQGRVGAVKEALSGKTRFGWAALATLMITANWFLFVFAIQIERVTETSLGYYMMPLVSVLLGAVVYKERLRRAQWIAVALAFVAVGILTLGLGVAPWISLTMALTFAIYGAIKKRIAAGPVVSVTSEVLLILPFSVLWLAFFGVGVPDLQTLLLLAFSGPLTALPLILFSYASKRIRLSTAGLLQYSNPTLQFFCAIVLFGEPWTSSHAVAFPLIWIALLIYSLSSMRSTEIQMAASARTDNARSTVSATVTKSRKDESANPSSTT